MKVSRKPDRPADEGQWTLDIALTPTIVSRCRGNYAAAITLQQMWFWRDDGVDVPTYSGGLTKLSGLTGMDIEALRKQQRHLADLGFIECIGKPNASTWDQKKHYKITDMALSFLHKADQTHPSVSPSVLSDASSSVSSDASSSYQTSSYTHSRVSPEVEKSLTQEDTGCDSDDGCMRCIASRVRQPRMSATG